MLVKRSLCLLVTAFIILVTKAQTIPVPATDLYKSATLPEPMREEAHAVVRYLSQEIVITAPGKARHKVHRIVTVLDEKADEEAQLVLFYDKKFNSVASAEMIVYDAAGVVIKKYKKGDMYDRSATDGFSIVTDDRVMVVGHDIASYPVTIETSFELSMSSFCALSDWVMQKPDYSVQNEWMKISVVPEVGFRFRRRNTDLEPVKSKEGIFDTYTWSVHDLKASKRESDVPSWKVTPSISFATNKFEYNGLPGDLSTWKSFGEWINGLNADVSNLSPQREEELRKLTAGLPTDREKAKFLYEYMQQNVRYVSIQLGIGGLKPFQASFVDQKKYGDCKALSNYMRSLLKAVNIRSYYSLVNAGENMEPADPAFANNRFNHVILCIPFKNDTTWLECTSTTQPFGKLGAFTENRRALMITENGGVLANTPRSRMEDNVFDARVSVHLDGTGAASAKMTIEATGEYRSLYNGMASEKADVQKEYLIRSLNLKQPSSLELSHSSDKNGVKEMEIALDYDKFSDIIAGTKQFYKQSLFDLWRVTVPVLDQRKSDFFFEHPLKKTCTTTVSLPSGFEVESMPTASDLRFSDGAYQSSCAYDPQKNEVKLSSTFTLSNSVIPAARYSEMQQFMDNVSRAQSRKLVIRKKD